MRVRTAIEMGEVSGGYLGLLDGADGNPPRQRSDLPEPGVFLNWRAIIESGDRGLIDWALGMTAESTNGEWSADKKGELTEMEKALKDETATVEEVLVMGAAILGVAALVLSIPAMAAFSPLIVAAAYLNGGLAAVLGLAAAWLALMKG